MNYASIRTCDIANGEGVRVSLFVSGCTHRCKGCFNPDQWDFDFGVPFTRDVEDELLDDSKFAEEDEDLLDEEKPLLDEDLVEEPTITDDDDDLIDPDK